MRIAVVGTGISGNVVGNLLSGEHEVYAFETNPHRGGHSQTVDVPLDGDTFPVDVGFMVYNERTYPGFCELLDRLEVATQASDMSFSVQCEASGRVYQGSSLNGLFAQRRNLLRPSFLRMIRDVVRFNRIATEADRNNQISDEETVGSFLQQVGVGEAFRRHYLVPMAAAIWSSVPNRILDFPARFLIGFFRNHGLLQLKDRPQWRTIVRGSRNYVERLSAPFAARTRTETAVTRVHREANGVQLSLSSGEQLEFDEVVMACHSDQALRLLTEPSDDERAILSSFAYQQNHAILHTDTSVMPSRPRAWASWNYFVPHDLNQPASVTYDLSRLQNVSSPTPILLTLNPTQTIDSSKQVRSFTFEHPIFATGAYSAQRKHETISGKNRTHFCGAYWRFGFHEDGLQSGLQVAASFGKTLSDLQVVEPKSMSTAAAVAAN